MKKMFSTLFISLFFLTLVNISSVNAFSDVNVNTEQGRAILWRNNRHHAVRRNNRESLRNFTVSKFSQALNNNDRKAVNLLHVK